MKFNTVLNCSDTEREKPHPFLLLTQCRKFFFMRNFLCQTIPTNSSEHKFNALRCFLFAHKFSDYVLAPLGIQLNSFGFCERVQKLRLNEHQSSTLLLTVVESLLCSLELLCKHRYYERFGINSSKT